MQSGFQRKITGHGSDNQDQDRPVLLWAEWASQKDKCHKLLPHENKGVEEGEKKQVIVAASAVSDQDFQLTLNPYDDVTNFNIPLINPSVNSKPTFAAADFRMQSSNIQADCT